VQRNYEREAAQKELADDVEKRVSALRKAREAVLARLRSNTQFCKKETAGAGLREQRRGAGGGRSGGIGSSSTQLVPLMIFR